MDNEFSSALISMMTCPITMMIMKDPVLASDGYFYERQAINHWVKLGKNSPMTRQPLKSPLYKCNYLSQYIEQYLTVYPDKKSLQYVPTKILLDYNTRDNMNDVFDFIREGQYEKLLTYTNYDLSCLMDTFDFVLRNSGRFCDWGVEYDTDDVPDYPEGNPNNYLCDQLKELLLNCKQTEVIKHVIDNATNIQYRSNNPIIYMCKYSTPELVEYVINKNVDLNIRDDMTMTPIHAACKYQTVDIIRLLVDKGVKLQSRTGSSYGSYLPHELLQFNKKLTGVEKYQMKAYIMNMIPMN